MENKSNNIRESSYIVAPGEYSVSESETMAQKVIRYQQKMKYVHELGIIKRNLAYTLNISDQI